MKNSLILILKGFVLGIANIIPGISGGTLAITLGIYEKLIMTISHFTKNFKENIKFILFLGIGMALAIGVFSNVIGYTLDKYPLATILFFIGVIVGGMPLLLNKVKGKFDSINGIIFLITFGIVMLMTFSSAGNKIVSLDGMNILKLLALCGCGAIAAATMVMPGISGSFVLMLLGYYKPIINTISDLTKFNNIFNNVIILGVFGIGVLIGIVCAAKIIEWLLKKFEIRTYYGIIGFVIASIISIFVSVLDKSYSALEIIIGILLMFIGMFISKKLSEMK